MNESIIISNVVGVIDPNTCDGCKKVLKELANIKTKFTLFVKKDDFGIFHIDYTIDADYKMGLKEGCEK